MKRKSKAPAANVRAAAAPVAASTQNWFEMFGLMQDSGAFQEPYAQHPWVHSTVRCIARNLKGVPIVVKRATKGRRLEVDGRLRNLRLADARAEGIKEDNGEVIDDPNHPIVKLFERPNPHPLMVSKNKLWEATALQLWLSGGSVWVKVGKAGQFVSSANEIPKELWPLPISNFKPDLNTSTLLPTGWWGKWGQSQIRFEPHQLIFLSFLNPYRDFEGLAPLKAVGVTAEADYRAMSYNAAFFENGAVSGGIIKTKANLQEKQARAVLDTWNDAHQGFRKGHRVGLLTGDSEFIPNTQTNKDAEFLGLRDGARRELTSTMGPVPPLLLGLSDDYTRATALEAKGVLFENTLLPEMEDIENVLAFEIGNWTGGENWIEFDLGAVECLRDNTQAKADAATKLFAMGFTLEQINERLEMGFDTSKLEHAKESFVPGTLKLASDVVAGVDALGIADPGGVGGQGEPPPSGAGGKGPAPAGGKTEDRKAADAVFSGERARKRSLRWHHFIRQVSDPAEAKGVSAFKGYVKKLRMWTLKRVEEVIRLAGGTHRDEAKKDNDPLAPLLRLSEAMIEQMLFNEEEWDRELRRIMGPVYRDSAGLALKHLREELGKTFHVIGAEDPKILRLLNEKEIKVVQINDTVRERIRAVLIKTASETATVSTTAAELQQAVGQDLKAEFNSISGRSLTIARTESAQVANRVRAEGMKAAGIVEHEWVSAQDSHVRESHEQANGEKRIIGQAFSNGLTHPGQIGAPAEEVINCRCVCVAVIPEAVPT